jgi:phage-related protein (TIGR01555 family)
MASVLLAKCDNLMELQSGGVDEKIRDLINQISIYRAGILSGKDIEITQHSASFGSVPELLMSFMQILSASADIPATRFLGQAPGGLNATGDSDLENYYNRIAADQQREYKPQLIKLFDALVPSVIGQAKWQQVKAKFDIEFTPLWNMSESEEAEIDNKNATTIDTLYQSGLIPTAEAAVAELRARNVLKTQFQVVDPVDQERERTNPVDLLKQIDQLTGGDNGKDGSDNRGE